MKARTQLGQAFRRTAAGLLLMLVGLMAPAARAAEVKTVFVIPLENHNWTQPASDKYAPQPLLGNPHAPFLNRLVTPGNPLSAQVSYASAYHNLNARPGGHRQGIHPSEPNYIWMEAGTNFGVQDDNPPYGLGGSNQNTTHHLATMLRQAGKTWKSYQEDIDTDAAGNVLPPDQWVSPIRARFGTYRIVANAYNGSRRFNYAPKHNPMIFFRDTNGGDDPTPKNPAAKFYAPIQQLAIDLKNNTVADYNWITPNQFNEMHSPLPEGYRGLKGDAAAIKEGDDCLAKLVPMIMASKAYRDNGLIIIWCDETEGKNADDYQHTLPLIVISPLAKGHAYTNHINYDHSSTLRTLQNIFGVKPYLGAAAQATDLSDLFNADTGNVK